MEQDNINWELMVKSVLKGELKKRSITYVDLCMKLKNLGVRETPENIANKLSRGRFTAVFFMQCLKAIDCKEIKLF